MVGDYTEDSLVEQPAIALFEELDLETANCFYESFKDSPSPLSSPRGRGTGFRHLSLKTKTTKVFACFA